MDRTPHILNASSNLLGIALLIITGLHLSNFAAKTWSDEIAWTAAMLFGASCLLSYLSIRSPKGKQVEKFADKAFLGGLFMLFSSVVELARHSF
ncbi:hypothetical protein BH09PSE3_BH09PSE3_22810 [soil metagenome]